MSKRLLLLRLVFFVSVIFVSSCSFEEEKIMNEKVYKILTLEEWDNAKETGEITTNLDQQDGFIHLSTSYQLAGTLAFYFNGFDNLILLEFESVELGEELIFEEPIPKGERVGKFPHYYAKLQTKLVNKSWEIKRNGFSLPKEVLLNSENFY